MGNTIIEINGKRYDARSGELIGSAQQKPAKQTVSQHRGRAIDGFMAPQSKPRQTSVSQQHSALKALPKKQRAPGVHASTPKPQKSQTLMRHAVQKPAKPHKPAVKAQAPTEMVIKKQHLPAPSLKLAAHQVNHPRMSRARRTPQSQQIVRFSQTQQNQPTRSAIKATSDISPSVQRTDYQNTVTRTATVAANKPVAPTHHVGQQQKQHVDIFEAAIANARSHEQPHHKPKQKPHKRVINIVAGVFAVLLLAGFFTFANKSNIEMRVASIRAGFSAQLPGYAPVGYALSGGIQSRNGAVATTYRSGESSYTLQQQVSEWDSSTLLDNIVAASDSYKEIQSQGRTIYIYGNNAAWVDGGVLYNIKGDGSITPKEISSIANSM